MPDQSDIRFYNRREAQERDLADRAATTKEARVHMILAEHYALAAQGRTAVPENHWGRTVKQPASLSDTDLFYAGSFGRKPAEVE